MRLTDIIIGIVISAAALGTMLHAATERPGFIVVAPDRGFMGNEETRDAFAALAGKHLAELVFVTDERGAAYFRAATERLKKKGAARAVVLPLYLSTAHPDFEILETYYAQSALPVETGRHFGRSAMAPRVLAERLHQAPDGDVLIAGAGAETAEQAEAMRRDLDALIDAVKAEFPHRALRGVIWPGYDAMESGMKSLAKGTQVLPFHLGQKLDSMMAWSAYLGYAAADGVTVLDGEVTPHPAVGAWMLREAARMTRVPDRQIGVVVHAHGSGFHWNETMRAAAAPLAEDFLVEYAFSMGDAPTLERAVRKLEERGAQAIVIVRVFGLEKSFRGGIERFIGADYEQCRAGVHDGHGHGGHTASPARLLSSVPVATAGGLEDHDLFAAALLDRAESLAENPEKETVILVAHGVGSDEGNAYWLKLLGSLRDKMLAAGGDDFRAIHVATWQEDWPDKRDAAIAHVRELIEQANRDGGRALLIPARTTEQGPARELVPDLDYALGNGFAPHPLFVKWLREQVHAGMRQLALDECASLPHVAKDAGEDGAHAHH